MEKSWIEGIKGVLTSTKGVFSVFIVIISAVLSLMGHLTPSFAAIISSVQIIFCAAHAYVNGRQMQATTTLQTTLLGGGASSTASASTMLKEAVAAIEKKV